MVVTRSEAEERRQLAQECLATALRRLAQECLATTLAVSTEEARANLVAMAQVWQRLADEQNVL
jgi:hypothetical protein